MPSDEDQAATAMRLHLLTCHIGSGHLRHLALALVPQEHRRNEPQTLCRVHTVDGQRCSLPLFT
jgi:hypothetical protein